MLVSVLDLSYSCQVGELISYQDADFERHGDQVRVVGKPDPGFGEVNFWKVDFSFSLFTRNKTIFLNRLIYKTLRNSFDLFTLIKRHVQFQNIDFCGTQKSEQWRFCVFFD